MFLILEGISYFSSLSAYADRALAFPHSPFQTVIHWGPQTKQDAESLSISMLK